jgi:release factor glutamine methyltransferase
MPIVKKRQEHWECEICLTVFEAIEKASEILKKNNIETPAKEAGVLLAFVMCKDVSWLYAHPECTLSTEQAERYEQIVKKRSAGMPYQYITNKQEFMSLDFYVNPSCLIPRPETEIIVEAALLWIKSNPEPSIRVVDIGTGSGAIAVSIAKYCETAFVDAIELSKEALQVAEINAERHNVKSRIKFIHEDFLQWEPGTPYSVVLSNPPYIRSGQLCSLMPGVRDYEPHTALDGGKDGLLFYKCISRKINRLLMPGGAIFVEVGIGQAGHVRKYFTGQSLKTEVYKDLAGIDRVVAGYKKMENFRSEME